MRCLKSINTERRDEFNRLFLKGILVWLAAVCICFLTQHLIYPDQLTNDYQLASFLGIILIYPIHKLLHIHRFCEFCTLQARRFTKMQTRSLIHLQENRDFFIAEVDIFKDDYSKTF